MTTATLSLFVVFDRPRDFPRHVVVREQAVVSPGQIATAFTGCLYDALEDAMQEYERRGLTWIPRWPGDDRPIVGVWI